MADLTLGFTAFLIVLLGLAVCVIMIIRQRRRRITAEHDEPRRLRQRLRDLGEAAWCPANDN